MLITNDTGPRHIAAAFGVPTVTLFGPTDPRWTTLPPGQHPFVHVVADPDLPPEMLADDHRIAARSRKSASSACGRLWRRLWGGERRMRVRGAGVTGKLPILPRRRCIEPRPEPIWTCLTLTGRSSVLVEQLHGMEEVVSSSLIASTSVKAPDHASGACSLGTFHLDGGLRRPLGGRL